MPGMTTEQISGSDESRWAGEFEQSSTGLVCKRCHAAVPQLGAHPEKHVQWCKAVELTVRRQTGAL